MAASWMKSLKAKMARKTTRFIISTKGQKIGLAPLPYAETLKEMKRCTTRALEMPSRAFDTAEMVAAYLQGKQAQRVPCRGVMPYGAYGNRLRKGRKQPMKLWHGTDGARPNAVAAPSNQGFIVNNWAAPQAEWKLYSK